MPFLSPNHQRQSTEGTVNTVRRKLNLLLRVSRISSAISLVVRGIDGPAGSASSSSFVDTLIIIGSSATDARTSPIAFHSSSKCRRLSRSASTSAVSGSTTSSSAAATAVDSSSSPVASLACQTSSERSHPTSVCQMSVNLCTGLCIAR